MTGPKGTRATVSSKLLARTMSTLQRTHGAVVKDGSSVELKIQGVISTGVPTLDHAIGRGGIPIGRLTILTGDESTGKTTLALQTVCTVQKQGGVVLYLDTERKVEADYAEAGLGVKMEDVIFGHPTSMEEAFTIMDQAISVLRNAGGQGGPLLIVLDSINATLTAREYDMEFDDTPQPASQARGMSRALPKLIGRIGKLPVALLFISQVRDNISTGPYRRSGKKTICGGRAVAFYSSLVIELYRTQGGRITDGSRILGQTIGAKTIKSQISAPFQEALFTIYWGKGVDRIGSLLDLGVALGVLNKAAKGGWYEMPKDQDGAKPWKWQGSKGFNSLVEDEPDVLGILEKRVAEKEAKRRGK